MKNLILHCLFILIVGITPVLAESLKIEIIPLKNRLVSDVIPVIKPLVVEGGTVTGMNNLLIDLPPVTSPPVKLDFVTIAYCNS